MILVDIVLPCMQQTLDFFVEETCTVREVTETVAGILRAQRKEAEDPTAGSFSLWLFKEHKKLCEEQTLAFYGVKDGDTLLMV